MLAIETDVMHHATTFRVQGELGTESLRLLERSWRQRREGNEELCLDLCEACEIDEAGKRLIGEMFAEGVRLMVRSKKA